MVTQMRATLPKGTILWDGFDEGMGQRFNTDLKESTTKLTWNDIFEDQDVTMIMIQSNYSYSVCSPG